MIYLIAQDSRLRQHFRSSFIISSAIQLTKEAQGKSMPRLSEKHWRIKLEGTVVIKAKEKKKYLIR